MITAERVAGLVLIAGMALAASACHRSGQHDEPDAEVVPAAESDATPIPACATHAGPTMPTALSDPFRAHGGTRFFPPGTFALPADREPSWRGSIPDQRDRADRRLRDAFGAYLSAMGEPPLDPAPAAISEAYRLLWIPGLAARGPFSVRVATTPAATMLIYRELSREPGTTVGTLMAARRRRLTEPQWLCLRALLQAADIWNRPTMTWDSFGTTDASIWILEAFRPQELRVVLRDDGGHGPLRALGRYLAELSGAVVNSDGAPS
jgi:hypothetical protein